MNFNASPHYATLSKMDYPKKSDFSGLNIQILLHSSAKNKCPMDEWLLTYALARGSLTILMQEISKRILDTICVNNCVNFRSIFFSTCTHHISTPHFVTTHWPSCVYWEPNVLSERSVALHQFWLCSKFPSYFWIIKYSSYQLILLFIFIIIFLSSLIFASLPLAIQWQRKFATNKFKCVKMVFSAHFGQVSMH